MSLELDSVCSHTEVEGEVGGRTQLELVQPDKTVIDASRADALAKVLQHLQNLQPPVYEGDIAVPGELKWVVLYGTLARTYRQAITTDGDTNTTKAAMYQRMYGEQLSALKPTVNAGERVKAPPSGSIAINRR